MSRTTSILAGTFLGAATLFGPAAAQTVGSQRAMTSDTVTPIAQTIKIPIAACMDEINDTLDTLFIEARSENDEKLAKDFRDIYRLMNRKSNELSAGALLIGRRVLKSLDGVTISPECELALQKRFADALTIRPTAKKRTPALDHR